MQGGKHQMTGFRGGKGGFDGIEVPHFADEDHIRVLTEDGPEAVGIGAGIGPDLPLVDDAFVRGVHILDGVLQGDDMGLTGMVDPVQHGSQGGGLTGAGFAGDQHNAGTVIFKVAHRRRQLQLFQLRNPIGQKPDGGRQAALLAEQVDSGADPAGKALRQVHLAHPLDLRKTAACQLTAYILTVLPAHGGFGQVQKAAVYPATDRQACHNMHIGDPLLLGSRNPIIQNGHTRSP